MPECALPSFEEIEDDNDENFVNDKIPLAFTQASERAIAAHQAFRDEIFVALKHLVPDVLSKVMAPLWQTVSQIQVYNSITWYT